MYFQFSFGSFGADLLIGGTGRDFIFGGFGNDRIHAGAEADLVFGGSGNDHIWGNGGNDKLYGDDGHDRISGGSGSDFVRGGSGNDWIWGGSGADYVRGGSGNDRLWGNGGNDKLYGDDGHDRISGGSGSDSVRGGSGNDWIWGGSGADYVRGGSGNDRLWGNSGNDKLYGDDGHDQISGGSGSDSVRGGSGNDWVWGGSGSDYVRGETGNDRLWGNSGNDKLYGDDGRDQLYGGRDDDVLNGGSGNDFLHGGAGFDVAVFKGPIENYTITQRAEFEWSVVGQDGQDVVRHVEMLMFDDAQVSLVSANSNPVILPQTATTDEDTPLQIDTLLAGATDPDGDTLEVSSVLASASGALVSLTADGTVIYNPNGAFEALAAGETALDTFVFTVSDGNGGTDTKTVSVTITGINDLPSAQNDFANGLAGGSLTLNLTGNDSDPDTTDDLTIAALDTTGTTGIVMLAVDGHSVTYDPNGGFSALLTGETAVDTFSYTVTDGNGGFDTATVSVTITGTNDGPFPVDGLASAENMTVGYTDLQGDQIDGTDGNDDTIFGNGGDDTIYSGLGNDTVDGGAGDDLFQIRLAGPGIDTDVIIGGETDEDGGGDTLDARSVFRNLTLTLTGAEAGTLQEGAQTTTFSEIERFILGDGEDTFSGAAFDSAVYVDGNDGTDRLVTGNGDDTLMGGFGRDTIDAGNGNNVIDGGDQNDTIDSGAGDDSVVGGSGDDNITTGAGSDTVDGGTGNNTINTASGVETADPNDDRDLVNTTSGYNRITTGEGADTINSGDGEDTIDAGSGDDIINAGGDDDSVLGGTGNDSILGGDGQNTIHGGDGNDTLEGGADTDVLRGGANDDLIFGRGGGDRIVDDAGDDTIHGNEGNDSLWGGVGTDSLLGGDDRDQIVYGVSTDAYGDTVDGGTGGADVDTLDLSRFKQLFRIVGQFLDADGDSTSGTVEFLDGDDVSGVLEFSEIEHLLSPAPVAVDDSASVGENDTVATEINLTDNDYEPDFGDTLNIASVDTTGTNGSVTINIDGQTVDYDPNGAFEWLGAGESVIDTFTYTVQDFEGFTDTATVSVTVTGSNDLPIALADSATVDEDDTSPTNINLTSNDIDLDASDVLAIQSVDTTGTLGTVSINADNASVDYDHNGLFNYLAVGEFVIDTFTYTVSDGNGGTDTETVSVTIHGENDAPVAYDYPTSVNLSEGDVTQLSMSYNDIDPDTSDVVEILSIDTTGVLGNVTINPDRRGATYDANGAFDYLGEGEIGRETFTYIATDNNGGTDTANVLITIFGTNDGPTAVDDTGSGNETGAINIDLTSNDTDPEVADDLEILSINTTGTLGSVTINADNDSVTYDPNSAFIDLLAGETAVDTFTYTISDGNGGTDTATVSVTLHGVDPDPVDGLETGELMEVGYTDLQGDQIDGPDGLNDIIFGNGGDDTIASGMGRDTVYGGAGDDRFLIVPDGTGIDANHIIGGETDEDGGGDTLDTSAVSRNLRITLTGSEQGTLTAGAQVTTFEEIERFVMGVGDDDFNARTSLDSLYIDAGDGDNDISTGFGNDTIIAGDGNGIGESDFRSEGGNNFIQTGAGDSTVDTGDGNDTVMTASGDDRITTGGGDDSIVGLAGLDVLRSGDGNDTINGGNEGSYIFSSDDFAFSADDKDLITAGRGDDTIFSGWDNDTIMSGSGHDYIEAGEGNDSVNAEAGDDTVLGGDGNDTISGGGDRDSLDGGDGDDTVLGGSGNDTILGGRGRDSLVGGDGNDTFLFGFQDSDGDTVEGGDDYDILHLTGFGPYRIVDEVIDPSDPGSMSGTVELLQSDGTTYRAAIYFSSIEEFVFV